MTLPLTACMHACADLATPPHGYTHFVAGPQIGSVLGSAAPGCILRQGTLQNQPHAGNACMMTACNARTASMHAACMHEPSSPHTCMPPPHGWVARRASAMQSSCKSAVVLRCIHRRCGTATCLSGCLRTAPTLPSRWCGTVTCFSGCMRTAPSCPQSCWPRLWGCRVTLEGWSE